MAKTKSEEKHGIDPDALSELELTLTVLWNSVRRWMGQRSNSSTIKGLSDTDVFLLHLLVYRNRQLKGADLAFALSIEDMHLVSYSLKKLTRLGLTTSEKKGKEVFYSATDLGREHYDDFQRDRKMFLEPAINFLALPDHDIKDVNRFLRALSGAYEQAARAAVSTKGE